MATQNSILLIIKQSNGVKYNSLLSKIAGNYSNINSARAALSRAIKYFGALGYVTKKDDCIFLTNKGLAKLNTEMKNKLLMRLDTSLTSKNAIENIDTIVEQFSTLIGRSKEDEDLMKMAKNSATFSISDLEGLSKTLKKRISHLNYLNGIMLHHIENLKKMDFRDILELDYSEDSLDRIVSLVKQGSAETFFAEGDQEMLDQLNKKFSGEFKSSHLFFPVEKLKPILQHYGIVVPNGSMPAEQVSLFVGTLQVKAGASKLNVSAPFSKIKTLK